MQLQQSGPLYVPMGREMHAIAFRGRIVLFHFISLEHSFTLVNLEMFIRRVISKVVGGEKTMHSHTIFECYESTCWWRKPCILTQYPSVMSQLVGGENHAFSFNILNRVFRRNKVNSNSNHCLFGELPSASLYIPSCGRSSSIGV